MFKYLLGNTMKNNKLITLATVTTLLFFLSGCGGSDTIAQEIQSSGESVADKEDNQTKESDVVVEFKTEGSYDLSNYLFSLPALTQKIFSVRTYTSDTDPTDTVYGTLEGTSFVTQTYDIDGNQRTYMEDGEIDTVYTLLNDRIQSEDDSLSEAVDIVRFADTGDYLSSTNRDLIYTGSNTTVNFNIQCRLKEHLESKNNFLDILQVVCQSKNELYRGEFFYAKDIGSILEVNSLCTQNVSNELNCTNVVSEYRILN
jgi:hypothetical protein